MFPTIALILALVFVVELATMDMGWLGPVRCQGVVWGFQCQIQRIQSQDNVTIAGFA